MANDNHLFSVTCYNVTMISNNYYTEFFELGQQKINFSFFELRLPDDDPVYTLKKVMEELDFTRLLAQYSNKGRNGYNPIMKYAVLTYANRYTFVWRGTLNYHLVGLLDSIDALYSRYNELLNDNDYGQKYDLGNVQMFIIEGMDKVRDVIEKNRKRKL